MKYSLSEATAIYSQDPDTWDPGECQELKLQALDSGAGKYLVIETQRWALDTDEISSFCEFLRTWANNHNES